MCRLICQVSVAQEFSRTECWYQHLSKVGSGKGGGASLVRRGERGEEVDRLHFSSHLEILPGVKDL